MLLASVTFMMSTFYLTNMEDEDLQQAAWTVMSATISIFSAVLLFQGINEVVAYTILGVKSEEDEPPIHLKLAVNFVHALLWYMGLQVVLAYLSGAVSYNELIGHVDAESDAETDEGDSEGDEEHSEGDEEQSEESNDKLMTVVLNMKCWATLFGHVTGFACINAFGTLQVFMAGEYSEYSESDLLVNIGKTFVFGPLSAWCVLSLMYFALDKVREKVALGDDGEEDEFEKMWDEETEETEDDVLGLTISFTVVQIFRMIITGVLPNEEGEVEGQEMTYGYWQVFLLIAFGVAIFALHIIRTMPQFRGYVDGIVPPRQKEQFKVIAGMIFAWCFFFGMQWVVTILLASSGATGEGLETTQGVCLACIITVVCYVSIFGLDKIADADWTDEDVDASIRQLIDALGILIGFAWEKSFDAAVVGISSRVHALPACVTKLLLSILICGTVIPAWRWYILPKLLKLGVFGAEIAEARGGNTGEQLDDESGDAKAAAIPEASAKPSKKGLQQPLLLPEEQDAAARQTRIDIAKLQQFNAARLQQITKLKVDIDNHAEESRKLPDQVKNVLLEVQRVKSVLRA